MNDEGRDGSPTHNNVNRENMMRPIVSMTLAACAVIANRFGSSGANPAASHASGVYAVITPFNAPKLTVPGNVNILQDKKVLFSGQPIAVIVARSLPEAQQAAKLLRIEYNR